MIRAKLFHQGRFQVGQLELVEHWLQQRQGTLWLDLVDNDPGQERALLARCGCHILAIQDAQRVRHPPKVEDFDDNTLVIYRGFDQFTVDAEVSHVQVAFFIGQDFLISRRSGPSFGVENLWNNDEELKKWINEPAVLFTRIVNVSLTGYTDRMLELEEQLSQLEDSMLDHPTDTLMQKLVVYRSRLRKLNRVFSYHEKVFAGVIRESTSVLDMENAALYHAMQDVYDKCERLFSLGSLYYDQCGDLIDGYLSLTSHSLNQTMQALTVITAIFVPLGLLSGIYGMNFEHMPELHFHYGYYLLLGVMVMVASVLLVFFKRKGWL